MTKPRSPLETLALRLSPDVDLRQTLTAIATSASRMFTVAVIDHGGGTVPTVNR